MIIIFVADSGEELGFLLFVFHSLADLSTINLGLYLVDFGAIIEGQQYRVEVDDIECEKQVNWQANDTVVTIKNYSIPILPASEGVQVMLTGRANNCE